MQTAFMTDHVRVVKKCLVISDRFNNVIWGNIFGIENTSVWQMPMFSQICPVLKK
jgi:hypothetical protein